MFRLTSAGSGGRALRRRWLRVPGEQLGEAVGRVGEEQLEVLLQESLAVAVNTRAVAVEDLSKVIVDTTVQEKAITFPTDAKLLNRARVMLVKLVKKHGVTLRQGYPKVGKLALMRYQRYAHAKQWKRAPRAAPVTPAAAVEGGSAAG